MNCLHNQLVLFALLTLASGWLLCGPASGKPAEATSVDLRFAWRNGHRVRVIPEPGEQIGNSCVGWAVAYAAKSYQESLDQDWLPDRPSRQFSPAFIYNLINGGVDQGGSAEAALQVVVDWGCATLATMPLEGHPLKRPSEAAFEEARNFRASGFRSLSTGREIKRALSGGRVVVVVVRTHPVFLSGSYRTYNQSLDQQGLRSAQPGDPHSTHSMCIVGYDDTRRAFLLMNSWGLDWRGWDGEFAGMVWVDYGLMRDLGPEPALFAKAAFVLEDIRHRVRRDPLSNVTEGTLFLGQSDRYVGRLGRRPHWEWSVFLEGDPNIRAQVAQVTYHLHPSFPDPDRVVFGTPDLRFAHIARGWGTFPVRATVWFKDGTSRRLETRLSFRSPITD